MENRDLMAAVRKLRDELGLTQTEFAAKIGRGMSTVQRWEQVVPPKGEALVQLMKLADASGHPALAAVFQEAISRQLGHEVPRMTGAKTIEIEPGEEEDFQALATILRFGHLYEDARRKWRKISEPVKEAERSKDYRAVRDIGVFHDILRRIANGETNEEISTVHNFPADDIQAIRSSRTK